MIANSLMVKRLIVPLSICAMAASAILHGILMIDDWRRVPGTALIIAGLATIVGTVLLYRRGKL